MEFDIISSHFQADIPPESAHVRRLQEAIFLLGRFFRISKIRQKDGGVLNLAVTEQIPKQKVKSGEKIGKTRLHNVADGQVS